MKGIRKGPFPFRFEIMWLKEEGFKETLRNWWQGISVETTASFVLMQKLKVLKGLLRSCIGGIFGNLAVKKAKALEQVDP